MSAIKLNATDFLRFRMILFSYFLYRTNVTFLEYIRFYISTIGRIQSPACLHMQPNRSKIPFPDGEVDGGVYLLADVGADGQKFVFRLAYFVDAFA